MRRFATLILAVALQAPAVAADPDPATLARGSEIAYRRALAAEAEKKALNADAAVAQRVRRIANRLVGAAQAIEPASRSYRWEVNVRADPAADVRAYPGGHLLINDGVVTRTGMKDDEAAAVIAFAIAHLLLGHDVARLAGGADAATQSPDPNRQVLGVGRRDRGGDALAALQSRGDRGRRPGERRAHGACSLRSAGPRQRVAAARPHEHGHRRRGTGHRGADRVDRRLRPGGGSALRGDAGPRRGRAARRSPTHRRAAARRRAVNTLTSADRPGSDRRTQAASSVDGAGTSGTWNTWRRYETYEGS